MDRTNLTYCIRTCGKDSLQHQHHHDCTTGTTSSSCIIQNNSFDLPSFSSHHTGRDTSLLDVHLSRNLTFLMRCIIQIIACFHFSIYWRNNSMVSSFVAKPMMIPLHSEAKFQPSCSQLSMGMKVTIRIVGRKNGGEDWLESACDMYLNRLKPSGLEVRTAWCKSDAALIKSVFADFDKNVPVIMLDPSGKSHTSEKFSENMYRWIEDGGSRLVFVIGGATGLPHELKTVQRKHQKVSLSALTFTHHFARLILIEQIYRASEIRKGSGYHK